MVYQKNEGMTSVPIQLDEYGSVFVVFRSDLPEQTAIRSIYKDSECLVDASVVLSKSRNQAKYFGVKDDFSISLWVKPESDAMLNTDKSNGIYIISLDRILCYLSVRMGNCYMAQDMLLVEWL